MEFHGFIQFEARKYHKIVWSSGAPPFSSDGLIGGTSAIWGLNLAGGLSLADGAGMAEAWSGYSFVGGSAVWPWYGHERGGAGRGVLPSVSYTKPLIPSEELLSTPISAAFSCSLPHQIQLFPLLLVMGIGNMNYKQWGLWHVTEVATIILGACRVGCCGGKWWTAVGGEGLEAQQLDYKQWPTALKGCPPLGSSWTPGYYRLLSFLMGPVHQVIEISLSVLIIIHQPLEHLEIWSTVKYLLSDHWWKH